MNAKKTSMGLIVMAVLSLSAYSQTATEVKSPVAITDMRMNASLLHLHGINFSSHYNIIHLPFLKNSVPIQSLPQGRLPIFCALEKKLTETCNLWIKIRLE